LTALKSLLPVLLLNNQALTTIALQLLEDAVQHSTSSYVLTKVNRIERKDKNSKRKFFIGCISTINWRY